jgi:hypothetical protein
MNISKTAAARAMLAILVFSSPVLAQRGLKLQFGVRAGVPLTKFMESDIPMLTVRETFDRAPLTVGPAFGAVLYDRFLIQLDALYKRVRGRSQSVNPRGAIFEFRAASFEFPLIVDYYFAKGKWRPYAGVGVMAGHVVTGTLDSHFPGAGGIETPQGQLLLRNQLPAYVANGGVEWNTSGLAIRPEVRYTRWSDNPGVRVPINQFEVSVGFSLDPGR